MNEVMIIIISTFAIATLLNIILKKFDIPTIIGYIFTGIIISKIFVLDSGHNEDIAHLAEFGIVFLMFTIGLEFSIEHLKQMKVEVFVNGLLQVILSSFLFFIISYYILDIDIKSSLIIATALSLSSTAIVLKIMNENETINTKFGKKSLGILLFQDIAVIPILIMVDILITTEKSISSILITTAIHAIIVLAILFIFGKYIVEKFLKVASVSNEIYIASILLIVLASSYIAHAFGFSYSLGAFIAGMTIAETKYKHQIEADLIPFRDILLGLFFITIGMQINTDVIFNNYLLILSLLIIIMTLKGFLIFFIIKYKSSARTAIKTAFSLSQVGEFSLVVLAIASSNYLIDLVIIEIFIPIIVLSMIITPFILKNIVTLSNLIIKEEKMIDIDIKGDQYSGHIIICGYSNTGKDIVNKLELKKLSYVIIEHDIKLVEEAKKDNKNIIFGNATQISLLNALNIKEASSVILAIEKFKKLQMVIDTINSIDKNIAIIAKVSNQDEYDILKEYNIKHVLNRSEVMSDILLQEALKCRL